MNYQKKMTSTVATYVMNATSVDCHRKNVRDFYILHTASLAIILLLISTIISHHYAKY